MAEIGFGCLWMMRRIRERIRRGWEDCWCRLTPAQLMRQADVDGAYGGDTMTDSEITPITLVREAEKLSPEQRLKSTRALHGYKSQLPPVFGTFRVFHPAGIEGGSGIPNGYWAVFCEPVDKFDWPDEILVRDRWVALTQAGRTQEEWARVGRDRDDEIVSDWEKNRADHVAQHHTDGLCRYGGGEPRDAADCYVNLHELNLARKNREQTVERQAELGKWVEFQRTEDLRSADGLPALAHFVQANGDEREAKHLERKEQQDMEKQQQNRESRRSEMRKQAIAQITPEEVDRHRARRERWEAKWKGKLDMWDPAEMLPEDERAAYRAEQLQARKRVRAEFESRPNVEGRPDDAAEQAAWEEAVAHRTRALMGDGWPYEFNNTECWRAPLRFRSFLHVPKLTDEHDLVHLGQQIADQLGGYFDWMPRPRCAAQRCPFVHRDDCQAPPENDVKGLCWNLVVREGEAPVERLRKMCNPRAIIKRLREAAVRVDAEI